MLRPLHASCRRPSHSRSTWMGAPFIPAPAWASAFFQKTATMPRTCSRMPAQRCAKSVGSGSFRFYTPEMNERASARFIMEADLRQRLGARRIVRSFSTQGKSGKRQANGCGSPGALEPSGDRRRTAGRLIPLAEESGLIRPLGQWVIGAVCAQLRASARCRRGHYARSREFVALPVPPGEPGGVHPASADRPQLPAKFIELEITESALMHDVESAVATMRELKKVGVKLLAGHRSRHRLLIA